MLCLALAMPKVVILTDQPEPDWKSSSVPDAVQMTGAMKQAILDDSIQSFDVEVMRTSELDPEANAADAIWADSLICPLTLNLPSWLDFSGKAVFDACRDVDSLRSRVAQWSIPWGSGSYWLPIVLTAKGPLYAEVIGSGESSMTVIAVSDQASYIQPVHLDDTQRQSLYQLGHQLLRSLSATPAVYLMQFGLDHQHIWFDRLIPFPAIPAIASQSRQIPDLFACHWRCISHQPIADLTIN